MKDICGLAALLFQLMQVLFLVLTGALSGMVIVITSHDFPKADGISSEILF